ncbi:MAG: HDIG domain-containing metalloprotein [Bacteroidota bacterium]
MSKLQTTLQNLPEIARYILVLLVIGFISFLFPNNTRFKYNFEQGQNWRYDDLYAPFDFAVLKSADQLDEEFEELSEGFSPIYEMDYEILQNERSRFLSNFREQLSVAKRDGQYSDVQRQPRAYERAGLYYLERILGEGIVRIDEQHQNRGKDFVVKILKGNETQLQTLQNLWDEEDARSFLSDSLPFVRLAEPDFLLPLVEGGIQANVFYNDSLTIRLRTAELSDIHEYDGRVKKGELIVPRSGIITQEVYQKLVSFREQYQQEVSDTRSWLMVFVGYFLLTSLIVGVFLAYLRYSNERVYSRFSEVFFMLFWLPLYSYLVYAVETSGSLSVYMIPFCIVPVVIKIFYDERLALFTHIVVVLIASFLSAEGYEFTFLQILAGIVAVLTRFDTRDWSRFFSSMLFIFLSYAIGYLGLSLVEEGGFANIDYGVYAWIFLGVFLTMLAYPLIPLLERLFGFTSPITLVELSDMNKPLLKELSLNAPGTLQHSLQVANLAEAAANAIGGNTLLVKVGALYHDIGKLARPGYFIENQKAGSSPHEQLNNFESARIILGHVEEGEALARKHKLPQGVIDFIRTHHGTTRVEYFYRQQLQERPDHSFDESLFRYNGPRPWTREQSILMMADSLEAASKSLKNPTGQDIDELVDRIVAMKITNGQLEESRLSFQELEACKQVFRQLLRSIYHVRIEYPNEEGKAKA